LRKTTIEEVDEEETKKADNLVKEAVKKAQVIKENKRDEKVKPKSRESSKGAIAKPRWNERKTSWKAADFDSVQALIEKAWQ
jgi:hypothetical protein